MENRSIPLSTLFAEFPLAFNWDSPCPVSVTGIAFDSRTVRPGNLFVAVKGGSLDGHDYIPQAIARGASAVVGEREMPNLPVPYVRVERARQSLPWLSAEFYGWPARHLTVIGVTGTDGKTTTCNMLHQILQSSGLRSGLISTLNAVIGNEILRTGFHVTTPDAPDVQQDLARMVAAGLTRVVLETTAHGWAQYRVDGCEFDVGVATNITHEHLDQHGSYENYRAARRACSKAWRIRTPSRREIRGWPS